MVVGVTVIFIVIMILKHNGMWLSPIDHIDWFSVNIQWSCRATVSMTLMDDVLSIEDVEGLNKNKIKTQRLVATALSF